MCHFLSACVCGITKHKLLSNTLKAIDLMLQKEGVEEPQEEEPQEEEQPEEEEPAPEFATSLNNKG